MSSFICEWRKQRDAGVLAGRRPGERVGRLTAEQAEIARLTRELARANKRLRTTLRLPGHHGKVHALLESLSERADSDEQRKKRYRDVRNADRTWCIHKAGSHIDRAGPLDRHSAAQRRHGAHARSLHRVCGRTGNKLTDAERRRVVEVLTSDRFVDLAPLQIYAQLLDEGVYLCSVSSSAGGFKGSGGQQRGGHVKARSNVGLRRVARGGSTFV